MALQTQAKYWITSWDTTPVENAQVGWPNNTLTFTIHYILLDFGRSVEEFEANRHLEVFSLIMVSYMTMASEI